MHAVTHAIAKLIEEIQDSTAAEFLVAGSVRPIVSEVVFEDDTFNQGTGSVAIKGATKKAEDSGELAFRASALP